MNRSIRIATPIIVIPIVSGIFYLLIGVIKNGLNSLSDDWHETFFITFIFYGVPSIVISLITEFYTTQKIVNKHNQLLLTAMIGLATGIFLLDSNLRDLQFISNVTIPFIMVIYSYFIFIITKSVCVYLFNLLFLFCLSTYFIIVGHLEPGLIINIYSTVLVISIVMICRAKTERL